MYSYSSHTDLDLIAVLAIGTVIGLIGFFRGFRKLKLKRMIQNIPTSKIRSLSMGLVEITGKAKQIVEITSPFSGLPCVFFHYIVQERRGSGRRSRWVTLKKASSPYPFLVDDGTGEIAVNPSGCDVDIQTKHTYSNTWFNALPARARKFMDMNGISYTSFLGRRTMRLTEYFIINGAKLYILGDARHSGRSLSDEPEYAKKQRRKKELMIDTIRKLKRSPKLMKRYDLNGDGRIDGQEWEKAKGDVVRWIDHNMSKEELKKTEEVKLEIGKGQTECTFFISDKSEKRLVKGMVWQSTGFVVGGALLTIACSGILIYMFFG